MAKRRVALTSRSRRPSASTATRYCARVSAAYSSVRVSPSSHTAARAPASPRSPRPRHQVVDTGGHLGWPSAPRARRLRYDRSIRPPSSRAEREAMDEHARTEAISADARIRDHYGQQYGSFADEVYGAIRGEAGGEDFGQNSWHTAEEHDRFRAWLDLDPSARLLDVACGSGGPTLRMARLAGCHVVGIDIQAEGIVAARAAAERAGLAERTHVRAARRQPAAAVSRRRLRCGPVHRRHQPPAGPAGGAARVVAGAQAGRATGLHRPDRRDRAPLQRGGGDPRGDCVLPLRAAGVRRTGPRRGGLRGGDCRGSDRATSPWWPGAGTTRGRSGKRSLREIEGDERYAKQQTFFAMCARLAREGRLSRFAYLARKPGGTA